MIFSSNLLQGLFVSRSTFVRINPTGREPGVRRLTPRGSNLGVCRVRAVSLQRINIFTPTCSRASSYPEGVSWLTFGQITPTAREPWAYNWSELYLHSPFRYYHQICYRASSYPEGVSWLPFGRITPRVGSPGGLPPGLKIVYSSIMPELYLQNAWKYSHHFSHVIFVLRECVNFKNISDCQLWLFWKTHLSRWLYFESQPYPAVWLKNSVDCNQNRNF